MNIVLNSNRSCASQFFMHRTEKGAFGVLIKPLYKRIYMMSNGNRRHHQQAFNNFPPFARETFSYSCWFSAVLIVHSFSLCVFFCRYCYCDYFLCVIREFLFFFVVVYTKLCCVDVVISAWLQTLFGCVCMDC